MQDGAVPAFQAAAGSLAPTPRPSPTRVSVPPGYEGPESVLRKSWEPRDSTGMFLGVPWHFQVLKRT